MSFQTIIPKILDNFLQAWNNMDMDKFGDLLDDDIVLTTPGLVFTNMAIKPQVLTGKAEVLKFITKTRNSLPIKSKIYDIEELVGKRIGFKVHYYEIDVWSFYDCLISQYGKFKELTITRLENTEGKKISTINVLKNVLKFRLKNLFCK